MSTTRLLVVHARSPLHAGTGQAAAAVDLPIARDRATGFPLLPGSSIKGALRARARTALPAQYTRMFGPETENASDHAGALTISDARLLLMPVRSVAGTFAWVTSPYLLASFAREAKLVGFDRLWAAPSVANERALVAADTLLGVDYDGKKKVVLEEFDLNREDGAAIEVANALAPLVFADAEWQTMLKRRLCIVHDDTMGFLSQHATEIVTRVSIDPTTGTAKAGQLWSEENLPAESVLVSLVEEVTTAKNQGVQPGEWLDLVQTKLIQSPVQLGGKATVGRGRCALHFAKNGGR
jgi:CRISPR-associated protein Cmr4